MFKNLDLVFLFSPGIQIDKQGEKRPERTNNFNIIFSLQYVGYTIRSPKTIPA